MNRCVFLNSEESAIRSLARRRLRKSRGEQAARNKKLVRRMMKLLRRKIVFPTFENREGSGRQISPEIVVWFRILPMVRVRLWLGRALVLARQPRRLPYT